jgi:hypothetical protein
LYSRLLEDGTRHGAKSFGSTTYWVNRLNLPPEELGIQADQTSKNIEGLMKFVLGTPRRRCPTRWRASGDHALRQFAVRTLARLWRQNVKGRFVYMLSGIAPGCGLPGDVSDMRAWFVLHRPLPYSNSENSAPRPSPMKAAL